MLDFDYNKAFDRNTGLISMSDQERIKDYRIAIPGMGGVGGAHLISLIRQGFEKFSIADPDSYEIYNFNRQYGANLETIGKNKANVMKELALKINPNCDIKVYNENINRNNLEEFLKDIDLAIDSIDFFEIEARRDLFLYSHDNKIPVISAGPIGFGTAYLISMPNSPGFDEYFDTSENQSKAEKLSGFIAGLVPAMLQKSYMFSKKTNINEKKAPSSIVGINLSAAVSTYYAQTILLNKEEIKSIPYSHQFDLRKGRLKTTYLRWGNKGIIQRIKRKMIYNQIKDCFD